MQETSAILADGGVWDDWDFPTSLFGPDCWSCTIAPRSTDLTQADGYGLYSMVEEARFRFGQHMGDIARNDGKGTRTPNREPIMMVTVSMRYFHFAPLRYPDPVTIHMAMGAGTVIDPNSGTGQPGRHHHLRRRRRAGDDVRRASPSHVRSAA